ncbi:hypothetical protein HN789_07810 [archaeon]|jgi:hypothetical protein|nr:hypothetical protein [archaeon]MBT4022829.1 hypothetical protein [archaeon]MBT4272977.1 hypothetical protein [archaeon]MBT4460932.1 hypothetical protein [archaeon]MBT4858040.1 hypothetical protein [archaeon]
MKKVNYPLIAILALFIAMLVSTIDLSKTIRISSSVICEDSLSVDAYYNLPSKVNGEKRNISNDLNKLKNLEFTQKELLYLELRKEIITNLNIDELYNNLEKKSLDVRTINSKKYENYTEHELLVFDEYIGCYNVLLLTPSIINKKLPAIIGLHGHDDTNQIFKEKYMGKDLANLGYVVIMPQFRAMEGKDWGAKEVNVSTYLYNNGFSLMGIRMYESLLLIKYLKSLDYVDQNNIGIIGHSGGSTTANLLVRTTKHIKALVTDNTWNFDELITNFVKEEEVGIIHCKIYPELYEYHKNIDDWSTLEIPFMHVPYAFEKNRSEIINFFDKHLK